MKFTPREMTELWRDGCWDEEAWFLREHPLLDRAGFPLELRKTAADALRWLYPTSVCRELIENEGRTIIRDLFAQFGWRVCALLEVGLDIATVGPFDDAKLIADLRCGDSFAAAATELSVWANLVRHEWNVKRVPTTNAKTPDFVVYADYRMHRIEVKHLGASDYARFREDASMALQLELTNSGFFPNKLTVIQPTPTWKARVAESLAEMREAMPQLVGDVRNALSAAIAVGGRCGQYRGGALAYLEILPNPETPNGSADERMIPAESMERREARAIRLISDATKQLRAGVGVVVLDVGEAVNVQRAEQLLVAKQEAYPVRFSSCETVIVRGIGLTRFNEPEQYAQAVPLRHTMNPVHERLADAIAYRRFRNPMMGRRGSRLIL